MELKKNPKLDYRKKSGLFFNIGLVMSLLFVISAFEWKFTAPVSRVEDDFPEPFDEIINVPITDHKIEPPKPKVVPVIIEIDEDDEIDLDDSEFTLDQFELGDIEQPVIEEILPDEEVEEPLIMAETMPSFEGGMVEFYKFVNQHLKYPAPARRMGIEGKVFAYFVVDKDGSLSDIKIVKGIGAGCDEEVLRIIRMSPKWNPGKQRGNPVRVRMMIPIVFKLG